MTFTTIAAGLTHTCGLTKDHAVFCWGANDSAQLGDGTTKNSAVPVRVSTGVRFKSVAPGASHTCAVATDDVGYCWGGNWHGQLGVHQVSLAKIRYGLQRLSLPVAPDNVHRS